MTTLQNHDKRYWGVPDQVIAYLNSIIPQGARVLEIGPGPFKERGAFNRADIFVDCCDVKIVPQDKLIKCNVVEEPLPFADKSVDFVYCRHVIEDLYNPFPVLHEMARVGKAGYIETPSVMAELARGSDGQVYYRGYHHHHSFVWVHNGQLRLLHKYPLIEYAKVEEDKLLHMLRQGPKYWNTYLLWEGSINWEYRQNVQHFHMGRDYAAMLNKALDESRKSIDDFWAKLPRESTVQQLLPQIGSPAAA